MDNSLLAVRYINHIYIVVERKYKKDIPIELDAVSSISFNRDQYFIVVANRDNIEDKEEFAKLLVQMCKENSFHTIKFSTDRGYATSVNMRVYLWKEDIERNDPVMVVEYNLLGLGRNMIFNMIQILYII